MLMFEHVGRYILFMRRVFKRPEKTSVFFRQTVFEFDKLGLDSLGIVAIISVFMGAVITLQTAYNIESPLIPKYTVGLASRDSILLGVGAHATELDDVEAASAQANAFLAVENRCAQS